MSHALALDSKPLALELYALLKELDPMRFRADLAAAIWRRLAKVREQLSRLLETREADPLLERLHDVATLCERAPPPDLPHGELAVAWGGYRTQLSSAYEALSVSLRERKVHVPALRPTNWTRSGFHVLIAMVLVVLVEEVLSARMRALVPVCFAVFFWTLEAWRHFSDRGRTFLLWLFRSIAHPHERYRVNSSTWFVTALALLGLVVHPVATAVAIAVLGFADPAAATIGRRFGSIKLVGNRSLQGTTAFAMVGFAVSMVVLQLWHAELALDTRIAVAAAAGICGALAELFSSSAVDDNFSIPTTAGAGAWLALHLMA